MREYLLDNHGVFNAGNDLGGATAMNAAFNINLNTFFNRCAQVMAVWRSSGVLSCGVRISIQAATGSRYKPRQCSSEKGCQRAIIPNIKNNCSLTPNNSVRTRLQLVTILVRVRLINGLHPGNPWCSHQGDVISQSIGRRFKSSRAHQLN